jgi:hypothetical protein
VGLSIGSNVHFHHYRNMALATCTAYLRGLLSHGAKIEKIKVIVSGHAFGPGGKPAGCI